MKTAGIIAEYNPFHNGHLYQIEEVRKQTGADYVVIVMSGDFVQRGEPAIFDKYTRTRMALSAGADLVLELPVSFATASAELFAHGAVSLFNQTGIVDLLCFGSESGSLDDLRATAEILVREPEEYTQNLRAFLKEGNSFPLARSLALRAFLESQNVEASPKSPASRSESPVMRSASSSSSSLSSSPQIPLSSPNDILGVEYLKALIRTDSSIEPFTIRREGQGYNDSTNPETLGSLHSTSMAFPSASALRAMICENVDVEMNGTGNMEMNRTRNENRNSEKEEDTEVTKISNLIQMLSLWIPHSALDALNAEGALATPIFADDFSLLLNSKLLELSQSQIPFEQFADLSPELASRLLASVLTFDSFSGRITALKSRQYTYTRISRALLHLLLGIKSTTMEEYKKSERLPYARILGFRKSASPLLSKLKANSSIPTLAKIAGAESKLSECGVQMLREELFASHLYQSVVFQKGRRMKNEYTRSIVLLP
ncbi:tRNA(Met) cytidine acetate ligase [Brotaphodocola sp.]|uniref:tRNA(Met) cytidine acetate ligase n=1 Tax=Brotaphodocola sp. TaxID=3073577 RepID=UPI003D7EE0F8